MTVSGWCSYQIGLTWIPFAPQISLWIRLSIQLWLLSYSFWASLRGSLTIWLIVSSVSLHILHFVCSCDLLIFLFIRLVRMACSWVAQIKLSASRFGVPFCNHCYLSWLSFSIVCCIKWWYNIFSAQEIVFSFLLLLLSLYCSFSDWLNQINIHRSRSSKQTLSGLFYIVF